MFSYSAPGQVAAKRLPLAHTQPNPGPAGPPNPITFSANLDVFYAYNNEGKLTNMSYPATASDPGPSYPYSFDTIMRRVGMTDQTNYGGQQCLVRRGQ